MPTSRRRSLLAATAALGALMLLAGVGATALVLAAPAGARILPVNEYSWGAAATYAKQKTRTAVAADSDGRFLGQYGWGAAATYAKLHV